MAQILVGIAHLALCQGRPADAAMLTAASVAVRGAEDLSHVDAFEVAAAARAALGDQEFAAATRRGGTATMTTARGLAEPVLRG
jgi:hypothetical protein